MRKGHSTLRKGHNVEQERAGCAGNIYYVENHKEEQQHVALLTLYCAVKLLT